MKKNLLLILLVLLLIPLVNVKADTIDLQNFDYKFGSTDYPPLPYNISLGANSNSSSNFTIIGLGTVLVKYRYLIINACNKARNSEIEVTGSCVTSCFQRGKAQAYSKVDRRCSDNNFLITYQIPIEKWEVDYKGSAQYKVVSPFKYINNATSAMQFTIRDMYLSTDDVVSSLIQNQEIQNSLDSINSNQQETNDKLDDILDADLDESYKEGVDMGAVDDYDTVESQLFDKINQADLSNVDVGIDINANNWIWDTLNRLINSHSMVFTMFLSILSIGIIKLALGR